MPQSQDDVPDFQAFDQLSAERREQWLEQLFTLLRQESISHDGTGMDTCAVMVQQLLEQAGLQTRIFDEGQYPIVYGELIRDQQLPTVLFYGHYDVMPPDPLEEWYSDPFAPEIRNGKIYARGAGDNKGQFLAHIMAIQSCLELHGQLPINVKILIEGEEETGSRSLPIFVEQHRDLLQADLVYTSDGPQHVSGAPVVLLGVRGALAIKLTSHGAQWDNHSGNKGNIVPNPIWSLVHLLDSMRSRDGQILVDGFFDDVRAVSDAEAEALRQLPFELDDLARQVGYAELDMDGESYYRRLTMEPTLNIHGIHSGSTGKGIIPAKAEAYIDVRLVPDQHPQQVYDKLARHVQQHAPEIIIEQVMSVPPSRTPVDLDIIQTVIQTVTEAYPLAPVIQPGMGGTLPNYVWTDILKAPSVIVPYAPYDEANHSPNENTGVDDFLYGIRCTYHLLHRLAVDAARTTV